MASCGIRDTRRLPIMAALGGMIVPAGIYAIFNAGSAGASGWGIPVATDIAFALGVLALVGRGVPVQLKVFLLTLAVADDVGGILIIAIFYSESIQYEWLLGMVGAVAFLLLLRQLGFRHPGVHAIGGVFLWLTLWEAGVHATLAGVILGLIVPANALYEGRGVTRRIDYLLQRLRHVQDDPDPVVREHDTHETLRNLEHISREGVSPLERLEEAIAPISAFVVVPIFALANAGISPHRRQHQRGAQLGDRLGRVGRAVAGQVLRCDGGIGCGDPPRDRIQAARVALGASWRRGAAGRHRVLRSRFFIANLSFDGPDSAMLLEDAKIGIFAASIIAAVFGFATLRSLRNPS